MKAFTDYPFEFLGDMPGLAAPYREIEVITYDGNKLCKIKVENHEYDIKAGYVYSDKHGKKVKLSTLNNL